MARDRDGPERDGAQHGAAGFLSVRDVEAGGRQAALHPYGRGRRAHEARPVKRASNAAAPPGARGRAVKARSHPGPAPSRNAPNSAAMNDSRSRAAHDDDGAYGSTG